MSKRYRIVGSWVDPYTWEVIRLDEIVSISTEKAARRWAKQMHYKCIISYVEEVR